MAFDGTKIVFPTNEDVLFMGENIFGHDFIHDFNTVNMLDRLSRIGSDIDKIATAMMTGGNPDEYILDEQLNKYLECGDAETYNNIRSIAYQLPHLEIHFSGRSNTRSSVKLIQNTKALICESKLFVMGFFNSVASEGEITEELMLGGKVQRANDDRSVLKTGNRLSGKFNRPVSTKIPLRIKQKDIVYAKTYDKSLYQCVKTGFDAAITDAAQNAPEMKAYFEFMKKLYLFFENSEVHPFTTFNNSFIEDAMVIYVFDPSYFDNDEKIYEVLSLLQNSGNAEQEMEEVEHEMEMNGGAPVTIELLSAFRDKIKEECGELFNYITDGTPLRDPEEFFTKATSYKTELSSFDESRDPDEVKLDKLIKQLKGRVGPKHAVLTTNRDKYNRASTRNKASELTRYYHALSDFIITSLYETVNVFLDDREERLSRSVPEGSLNQLQVANVQKIAATVAFCVKTYVGVGNGTNSLLNAQQQILQHISNNKNIGSADNNLLNAFRAYVTGIDRTKAIDQRAIAAKIGTTKVKNVLRVIDNAAPQEAFRSMGITDKQIYCPNSSIVDPMGSFGSCSGIGENTRREKYHMKFMISTEDERNSYIGQSLYGSDKILKVMYYANFNEFILPHVETEIDMTSTKNITVLSANNTFKSVINKVLLIWKTRIVGALPSPAVFWDMLKNKAIFSELVSVGSLKSVGDLYQEINSSAKNGAYTGTGSDAIVSSYRIGAMGDRPSGVRAGYILFRAISGKHPTAIAGYFDKTGPNTFAIINEQALRGGRTKKRSKHNKKQSRKLKA